MNILKDDKKKGKIILIIGIILIGIPAIIALLTIFGIITPVIFRPTGKPLDVMPLINVLCWFLMLVILIYVGTRIIDWGINYLRGEYKSE